MEPQAHDAAAVTDLGDPAPAGRSVLAGLRSLFGLVEQNPAAECARVRLGTGVEPPTGALDAHPWVVLDRTFAFVDISGFTRLCEERGPHEALALLTGFRAVTREVAARRGVRVAKWLGDGVMLVAADPGPAIAAVAELVERTRAAGVDVHAGLAAGEALLFEGDDYVGRPVNLAARLGAAAGPGEVLAWGVDAAVPEWVRATPSPSLELAGVGRLEAIVRLESEAAVRRGIGRSAA